MNTSKTISEALPERSSSPDESVAAAAHADMTPEQLARFDAASNHRYDCKCELCKEWWELVGPEDE